MKLRIIAALAASVVAAALPIAAASAPRPAKAATVLTGSIVQAGGWNCSGPVDLDLVKITGPSSDAVVLDSGCTGTIDRIEIDQSHTDGVKIQNGANPAHDLTIGGGYVVCHGIDAGAHQDAVQAMGGARITFTGVTFNCLGNSNFFVNRGGSGATTPTDIVCNGCRFGAKSATTVRIGVSVRSGVRNSTACVGRQVKKAILILSTAVDPVNENNTVAPSSDPLCTT